MHRDVSIGNLLKLDHPATREEFSIKTAEDFVGALNLVLDSDRGFDSTTPISIPTDCREPVSLKTSELLKSALRFTDPREKMEGYLEIAKESLGIARAVKNVASQLGASTTCKAIISDGDLAAYMPTYFSTQHERGTISVSLNQIAIYFHANCEFRAPSNSCLLLPDMLTKHLSRHHTFSLLSTIWSLSFGSLYGQLYAIRMWILQI